MKSPADRGTRSRSSTSRQTSTVLRSSRSRRPARVEVVLPCHLVAGNGNRRGFRSRRQTHNLHRRSESVLLGTSRRHTICARSSRRSSESGSRLLGPMPGIAPTRRVQSQPDRIRLDRPVPGGRRDGQRPRQVLSPLLIEFGAGRHGSIRQLLASGHEHNSGVEERSGVAVAGNAHGGSECRDPRVLPVVVNL